MYNYGNTSRKNLKIGHFVGGSTEVKSAFVCKMPRKNQKSAEEVRKRKREAEKRRREKIKADPVKYEEHKAKEKLRRKKRKEEKKDLSINDLSERAQRIQRKQWRERARKSRAQKKKNDNVLRHLQENSPPSTDIDENVADAFPERIHINSNQEEAGAMPDSVQNNREEVVSPSIIRAGSSLSFYDRNSSQFSSPSRMSLSGSNFNSPSRQKVTGSKVSKRYRKLQNMIIKKQRAQIEFLKKKVHALTMKFQRKGGASDLNITTRTTSRKIQAYKKKLDVQRFLERDENSILCPGKKDTISFRGKTKQKRYLCDTLENLYMKYNSETNNKISYTTFTRYRPFWIVAQKVTERDTCACYFHENFKIAVDKLRQLNIIQEKTAHDICNAVTCNSNKFECMMRQCDTCLNKTINITPFDNLEKITYDKWMNVKETRSIKGKEKNINRTVKRRIECSKKELIEQIYDWLPSYLKHVFTISHQYKAISHIKETLSPGEVVLHIDFSENYQCKYASEVQSVHFGASREQICLHTCVLYHHTEHLGITPTSFCSVSKNLRHDAAAVYAHLKKSLKELLRTHDINFHTLHILSDGPSGQYKNKSMFFLFTQHLVHDLGIKMASWNFSESGHGKGPADGIGATIKRTADALVAQGHDIPDFETFVTKITIRTNILLMTVQETDILQADALIPKKLKVIPDTKMIRQITWSSVQPKKIFLRQLSCVQCGIETICPHFSIRQGFFEMPDNLTLIKNDMTPSPSHNEIYTENDLTVDCMAINKTVTENLCEEILEDVDGNKTIEPEILADINCKTTKETDRDINKNWAGNENNETESRNMKELCAEDKNKANKENGIKNRKTKMNILPVKNENIKHAKKVGSWVVVKFESKMLPVHFIGQIISLEENKEKTYIVKFLRKKNLANGVFSWHEPEDVSLVVDDDIVSILSEPTPTRRGELIFKFDFLNKKYKFK